MNIYIHKFYQCFYPRLPTFFYLFIYGSEFEPVNTEMPRVAKKTKSRKTKKRSRRQSFEQRVIRVIQPELKHSQITDINTSIGVANTATTIQLTGLAQGITANERIGTRVKPWYLRFREQYTDLSDNESQLLRRIIYIDWEVDGTVATNAELLQVTSNPMSNKNMNNLQRFTILKDDMINLPSAAANNQSHVGDYFFDLRKIYKNKWIQYEGTTATISNARSGGIFCFWMPMQTETINGSFRFSSMFTYTDN